MLAPFETEHETLRTPCPGLSITYSYDPQGLVHCFIS
uniref:YD repeat-containing protein n=1 Tax=Anguilla anguilla TaxID=7936 RepID=A0A0E9RWP9_ANGAN